MSIGNNENLSMCECKVGRVLTKYELSHLDNELIQRHDGGASLRDLETFVNAQILHSALDRTEAIVVGDTAVMYEALDEDGVSVERREEIYDKLQYSGVDVEEVQEDFISHQTIRDHLRSCRDIDTSRRGITTIEEGNKIVSSVRNRDEEIVERTLTRLQRTGVMNAGELEVNTQILVTCDRCGVSQYVGEFLNQGGCECQDNN